MIPFKPSFPHRLPMRAVLPHFLPFWNMEEQYSLFFGKQRHYSQLVFSLIFVVSNCCHQLEDFYCSLKHFFFPNYNQEVCWWTCLCGVKFGHVSVFLVFQEPQKLQFARRNSRLEQDTISWLFVSSWLSIVSSFRLMVWK